MNLNEHPNRQPNEEPMPEPDPTDPLDRVLTALTSAVPPTGMEQRILHAVELRLATEPITDAPQFWLRRLRPQRILHPLAFAAAFALLIFAFIHLFRAHPTEKPPQVTASEKAAPFEGPSLHLDPAEAHKLDPMPTPVLDSTGLTAPGAHPPAHQATQPTFFLVAALVPPPPVAASEAPAPPLSFPAPPMPLTAQERLLLRIVHRNDPQSLDALTPEKLAAQQAQDASDFETFFPQPEPVEYPALLLSRVNQPAIPH